MIGLFVGVKSIFSGKAYFEGDKINFNEYQTVCVGILILIFVNQILL
jgi:hypothetical protein